MRERARTPACTLTRQKAQEKRWRAAQRPKTSCRTRARQDARARAHAGTSGGHRLRVRGRPGGGWPDSGQAVMVRSRSNSGQTGIKQRSRRGPEWSKNDQKVIKKWSKVVKRGQAESDGLVGGGLKEGESERGKEGKRGKGEGWGWGGWGDLEDAHGRGREAELVLEDPARSRRGHGTVTVRSRYGHGRVTVRSRYGHSTVPEVRVRSLRPRRGHGAGTAMPRCGHGIVMTGHGTVKAQSRCYRGPTNRVQSRHCHGTFAAWSRRHVRLGCTVATA
jgi:hypothetical protein